MHPQLPSVAAFLPHENPAEFYEFRGTLISTWQPANAQELLQIDLIADAWWRMARANRYESEFFTEQLEQIKRNTDLPTAPHARDDRGIAIIMSLEQHDHALAVLSRYAERAASKYFRALACLEKMQAARRREERLRNRELGSFRQGAAPAEPPAEPKLASFGAPVQHPESTAALTQAALELASFSANPVNLPRFEDEPGIDASQKVAAAAPSLHRSGRQRVATLPVPDKDRSRDRSVSSIRDTR